MWGLKIISLTIYSIQLVGTRRIVMCSASTTVCLSDRSHVGLLVGDRGTMLLLLKVKILVRWLLLGSVLVASYSCCCLFNAKRIWI
jgi:hypothetical protein